MIYDMMICWGSFGLGVLTTVVVIIAAIMLLVLEPDLDEESGRLSRSKYQAGRSSRWWR